MAYITEDPQTKDALRELIAKGETLSVFEMGDKPVNRLLDKVQVSGPQDPDAEHWYALVVVDDEYHVIGIAA